MDWSIVISRQKAALLAVVARIWAMAGGAGSADFLPSPLVGSEGRAEARDSAPGCGSERSDETDEGLVGANTPHPTSASLRFASATFSHKGEKGGRLSFPLPRLLKLAILRLLRPAESAARRLIVIVAAGLVLRERTAKGPARPLPDFSAFRPLAGPRPPTFRLFDNPWVMVPRAFGQGRRAVPRVRVFGADGGAAPSSPRRGEVLSEAKRRGGLGPQTAPSPGPDGPPSPRWGEDATSTGSAFFTNADQASTPALHRRISALHHALNTLPQQARRLKRIMAARQKAVAEKAAKGLAPGSTKNPLPLGPMRPGRPPGHIIKPRNEADLILKDCQDLALYRTRVPQPPP